jgi:Zn-dependent protease
MRQDYWSLGTWGRIPVSMHWTVLLAFAWLYLFFFDVVATLFASVAFFLLLAVHELGHVVALRSRRIPVTSVALFGIHGETTYNEYSAKAGDVVLVAWSGVIAQALVLAAALAVTAFVRVASVPWAAVALGPMLVVFVKLNVFLMIIALLPIGPFDGRAAWQVIPRTRNAMRRRHKAKASARKTEAQMVEPTPDEERAYGASSRKETDDLIARLTKRSDAKAGDN